MNNTELLFVGDCLLSSSHWNSDLLSDSVKEEIHESDEFIANLEAPIPDGQARDKFAPSLSISFEGIERLSDIGVTSFTVANNHIMDYGSEGLEQTIDVCDQYNIDIFGAGVDREAAFNPLKVEAHGQSIGIIGLSQPEGGAATSTSPGTAWIHEPDALFRVQRQSEQFDVTILVVHGGLEYIPIPPRSWRALLRRFTQLEIDAIVGHHPHTPQGWEVWDDVPIFYSLGNFLMHRQNRPSTEWSIMLKLIIDSAGRLSFSTIPVEDISGTLELMSEEDPRREYLDRSSSIIDSSEQYTGCWQAIACQLWEEHGYQYKQRLTRFGLKNPSAFLTDPMNELDRLTLRQNRAEKHHENVLALYNYLRNPSHVDAMKTATRVRSGLEEDLRSTDSSREMSELLKVSKGDHKMSFSERQINRLKILIHRLV